MTQGRRERRLVLAIDDHPSILRFIQIGFEMRDIDVITASSGRKGLDLADSAKPDAIILDVMMPDMDGFDVLKRLRGCSVVPTIVISADPETRSLALELGATEFLAKPFNTDYLVKRMKALLGDT
jgi:DNA-binding response OmpR family regulator